MKQAKKNTCYLLPVTAKAAFTPRQNVIHPRVSVARNGNVPRVDTQITQSICWRKFVRFTTFILDMFRRCDMVTSTQAYKQNVTFYLLMIISVIIHNNRRIDGRGLRKRVVSSILFWGKLARLKCETAEVKGY